MKEHNKTAGQVISTVLLVIILILIFLNSAKTAPESSAGSSWITLFVLRALFGRDHVEQMSQVSLETTETLIRKAAHITEYCILALSTAFWQTQMRKEPVSKDIRCRFILFTLLFCVIYAASDEFHQLFVAGRSGQVTDVLIDSIGIVIGTFLFYLILSRKWRNHGSV